LEERAQLLLIKRWLLDNGQKKDVCLLNIDGLKEKLGETFGKDPMESKDPLHMVNSDHLNCLERILDEDKVFNRIVVEAKEIKTN